MERQWLIREADWPLDAAGSAEALAAGGELAWLDSALAGGACGHAARYSMICVEPLASLVQYDGRPATLRVAGRVVDREANGWRLWRRTLRRLPRWRPAPVSLSPGWVGYVAFEMARQLERLPASHREDLGLPLLRLALFDRAIVLDRARRRALALVADGLREALGEDGPAGRPAHTAQWLGRWRRAARAAPLRRSAGRVELCCELARPAFEQMVVQALEHIRAGQIYQVNLAQRMRLAGAADPLAAYAALRRVNPAPYGALLRWPGAAVASASPELFLRVRGDAVLTRPIKGTRPRARAAALDEDYRRQLLASAKDAAELAMIVDLHRNDLGRVCAYGSVRVAEARRVEAHPTVFHTVADVVGRLAAGRDALDALRACFPAGSVSGVPKIRALELIDELEPVARGVYTGAIGVLGLDRQAMFNVAIRTLQMKDTAAALHVGGGIVAESDPAEEYRETLDKARGILAALRVGRRPLQVQRRLALRPGHPA